MLDNFEHVLSAAWVAERLLGSAQGLRILATSRAPLRLYGEQELPVPPLALPETSVPTTSNAWPDTRRSPCSANELAHRCRGSS